MKNGLKKLLAIVLSLAMILSLAPLSFAKSEKVTPVVVVSGMGSRPLYDEEGNQVWSITSKSILDLVKAKFPDLLKFLVDKDYDALGDAIMSDVYESLFEKVSCDEKGDSVHKLTTQKYDKSFDNYPDDFEVKDGIEDEEAMILAAIDAVGAENTYFFNYDWRLDPLSHADDLNALIESVKKEKNCEKVILIPGSMGGVITNSYLYKYGSSSCEKIIYAMTAFQGLDLVGELFNKNLDINTETLTEYLFTFQRDKAAMQILMALIASIPEILPIVGESIDSFVAEFLDALSERSYNEILIKGMASAPGMWSFVNKDYYESAKKAMFSSKINKDFEKKIDEYHYNVQLKSKELMDKARESGTSVVLLASYGFVGSPFAKTAYVQSDCLIETHNEAGGATVALYGKTLGDKNYKPVGTVCSDLSHNHISTDCIIDASSGMYPENTWYIKYNRHIGLGYFNECKDFLIWLIGFDGQPTVFSNEKYPQFMKLNNTTGKLTSLTGEKFKKDILDGETTILSRFIIILRSIFDLIENALSRLGAKK